MDESKEQLYDRQSQRNPFLQDLSSPVDALPKDVDSQSKHSRSNFEEDKSHNQSIYNESKIEYHNNDHIYSKDVYGELNPRTSRGGTASERSIGDRRTPENHGRSTSMSNYNKDKISDYEDIYGNYGKENDYGKTVSKSPKLPPGPNVQQQNTGNYVSLYYILFRFMFNKVLETTELCNEI